MKTFIIVRRYGNFVDHLTDWSARYGTSCSGHKRALVFNENDILAAVNWANNTCHERPSNMIFSALEL